MANAGTLEFDIRSNYKDALDGLDKVGKKLEKFGRDVIELSGVMTAFGGVMVNEAAKYDATVGKAVENLKGSYARLSVEIGKTLAPVVEEAANLVEGMATAWRSLDKESKEAIQTAFKLAAEIGAVAAALTLVGKGFGLLADVGSLFAAMISPVGAFAAAILTSAAAVLYLVGAYDRLKASGKSLFEGLMSAGVNYAKFIANLLSGNITGAVGNLVSLKKDVDEFGFTPQQMTQDFVGGVKTALDTIAPGLTEALKKAFSMIGGATSKGRELTLAERGPRVDVGFATQAPPFVESASVAGSAPAFDWGSLAEVGPEVNHFVDAIKGGTDRLLMALGTFGEAVTTVKNGIMKSIKEGNSGGIWEMIVNLVLMFVQRTKGFDKWFDQLEKQMDKISDIFEQFIPAIMDATAIADPIIDFVDALLNIIPVANMLSVAFGVIGVQTKNTFGLLSLAIGELVYFVGKILGNKKMIGGGLELEQSGRAMLEEARDQWSKLPDIMNGVAESGGNAAKALDKFSESLTNVPTGFRVDAARYNATDMGPVHGASPVPGGGSTRDPNASPPPGVPGGWADSNGLPPSPPNRNAPVEVEVTIEGDLAPLIERIAVRQRQEAARERSNRDGRYRNAYSDAGGAY